MFTEHLTSDKKCRGGRDYWLHRVRQHRRNGRKGIMNVKECYAMIGGDYEDMKRRFLTDARIQKFALMFLRDRSMEDLRAGMRDEKYENAFLAAHTLKGVCLNLGFSGLYAPVCDITEKLRAGNYDEAAADLPLVEQAYEVICEGLRNLS